MLAVLIIAAGWSYRHHADWFFYNDNFNADFIVTATFDDLEGCSEYYTKALSGLTASGELWPLYELVEPTEPRTFDSIYEVSDGAIVIDKHMFASR